MDIDLPFSDDTRRVRAPWMPDSGQEERFDRLTRLTAIAMAVPIALVSLVDEERQWFKSRVGLDATETARSIAFCTHAVARREMLVVEDALQDPRFHANPLRQSASMPASPCSRTMAKRSAPCASSIPCRASSTTRRARACATSPAWSRMN
ncbi:GAF domain-containing protein [Massilia sp. CCM 9210]|uniref:GAF domain-containing protein n=1 Tax=Massilia scottii TaxID=3057166 RepID=UPI0027964D2E|nr:GAF domain-containing protein [Massilia sp. CCM 9210]MDQ1815981.1 GAF domain-containing protein [Massilia sp. CCM 9210]